MNIRILQLVEGAQQATGLTVIIDVFRAFTVACYLSDGGAEKIIPIGAIEEAYTLKKKFTDAILVGERNEQKPEGFDLGNSPTIVKNNNIAGKLIVHCTSSGTQGIVNALQADEIITGSFVNADAIVRYIKNSGYQTVSLCAMGYASTYPTQEDTLCAEYIKAKLLGENFDFEKAVEIMRNTSGKRFFEIEKQDFAPESDFFLCTELNKFDFVLRVERDENNNRYLKRIESK